MRHLRSGWDGKRFHARVRRQRMAALRRLVALVFSTAPSSLPMVSAPATWGPVASGLVVLVALGSACASSSEGANSGPPAFAGALPPALESGGEASPRSTPPPELNPGAAPPADEGAGAPGGEPSNGNAGSAPAATAPEASDPEASAPEADTSGADTSETGPIAPPLAPRVWFGQRWLERHGIERRRRERGRWRARDHSSDRAARSRHGRHG
jgi:hypothetical protein